MLTRWQRQHTTSTDWQWHVNFTTKITLNIYSPYYVMSCKRRIDDLSKNSGFIICALQAPCMHLNNIFIWYYHFFLSIKLEWGMHIFFCRRAYLSIYIIFTTTRFKLKLKNVQEKRKVIVRHVEKPRSWNKPLQTFGFCFRLR